MAFQLQVMHDITLTKPFSYKNDLVMTELATKYRFDFLWGGNMISEQIIKNPCRDEGMEPSYPGRLRRPLVLLEEVLLYRDFLDFLIFLFLRGLRACLL